MQLKNLSLRTKLMGGFGLVLAIALLQGIVSLQQLRAATSTSTEIASTLLPGIRTLSALHNDLAEMRVVRLHLTMAAEPGAVPAFTQQLQALDASLDQHRADYARRPINPREKALFDQFETRSKAYQALGSDIVKQMQGSNVAEARKIVTGPGQEGFQAANAVLDELAALHAAQAQQASGEASAIHTHARLLLIGSLVLLITLGMGIGWAVSRDLTNATAQAVLHAGKMAEGDLSHTLAFDRRDEMGALLDALAKMQGKLRTIVSGVRQNADSVATASAEISQGNHDLSHRTEQQAGALGATTASIEELAGTVKQNADNARQANQLAMSASTVAVSGGEVVNRVVDTMKGINDSSKRIADIIGVIDGIAFQTNILALNAAVEAARAGEQGRGFAVVASEVRSLAQRSAEAAKEIKTLISASVERVEQGTALVDQAGTTMQEVVLSIKRVTDIMGEISAASIEQSAGVSQVGAAVTQMGRATQQNATLVEQSAGAADKLKTQAQHLVSAVAVFKLGERDTPRPVAAPPAPRRPLPQAAPATNVTRLQPKAAAKPVAKDTPSATLRPAAAPAAAAKVDHDAWESF